MIISFYPSAEINFVEIHLCMLQCWLLKQSWKQTPCGGKEEGEQGEKKKKTENFGHSSQKASCVLWCSEKKKKGVCVSTPPEVTQQEQIPSLSCCLFNSLFPYLREAMKMHMLKDASLERIKRWKILFAISLKVTIDLVVYQGVSVTLLLNVSTFSASGELWKILNYY